MARMSVQHPVVSEELVVRPAGMPDLGRIVEMLRLGRNPGRPTEHRGSRRSPSVSECAARDRRSGGAVLVAELAGEVVGACQLIVFRHLQASGGRCAEIESVHVHPDHRGSGVGKRARAPRDRTARGLGCYRVQLTSNTARPDAHRFYERLGFVPSHVGFKMFLYSRPSACRIVSNRVIS